MPGTGPLRRSSVLARKKAIVGKSLVAAEWLQRPSIVFVSSWLHVLKLLLCGELGWGQVDAMGIARLLDEQQPDKMKPISALTESVNKNNDPKRVKAKQIFLGIDAHLARNQVARKTDNGAIQGVQSFRFEELLLFA